MKLKSLFIQMHYIYLLKKRVLKSSNFYYLMAILMSTFHIFKFYLNTIQNYSFKWNLKTNIFLLHPKSFFLITFWPIFFNEIWIQYFLLHSKSFIKMEFNIIFFNYIQIILFNYIQYHIFQFNSNLFFSMKL